MGVYIKGFQLPEKSDMYYVKVECEAGKNPVATIWRKDLIGEMSFGAFEIIPIPPHGRLIDADAYEELIRGLGNREYRRENGTICDAIKFLHQHYAPTIIPAEEGET